MLWVLLILFLLSRRPQTSSAPGGMTPIEPIGDTQGVAIDASTGRPVLVAQPLPLTIPGNISPSLTFGIDAGDEAFAAVPPIDASLAIVPTQPQFRNPDTLPGAWPGLAQTQLAPGISVPAGSSDGIISQPAGVGTMYAAPLPAVVSQLMSAADVPTGNTFSAVGADGTTVYYMEYLRPDGSSYRVPFDPFVAVDPRQVATTPLGELQNTNPNANPYTGTVQVGGNV